MPDGRITAVASATAVALAFFLSSHAAAQVVPDLVSRTALRVCADPSNLPFSNKKKQGFENKIADIVADQLKEPVRYFWAPSGPGFIRNTLGADLCDIVMGYTVGAELVQSTNPYYRSTYAIVAPKGSELDGIETMDDPRLKGRKIGVFDATPPVDVLLSKGLMSDAKLYPLIVDHRFDSPISNLIGDLKDKKVDAAIVWGPLIGAAVKESNGDLVLTPLLKDVGKPGFSYRISFGVRHDENEWKHKLEGVLRARQADINKVLVDYGVPLIDNSGRLVTAQQAQSDQAPKLAPPDPSEQRSRRAPAPMPQGFKMPGPAPANAPQNPK